MRIMVCGRVGVGKSSFVNALCNGNIAKQPANSCDEQHQVDKIPPTDIKFAEIDTQLTDEMNYRINLRVIEVEGFGGSINSTSHPHQVKKYIEAQYEAVLDEEFRIHRTPNHKDGRVHCCLYLLEPTAKGLRPIDLEAMILLSPIVNLLPVIAKSDTMTGTQLKQAKDTVRREIEAHNIPIFSRSAPVEELDDDDEYDDYVALQSMVPLAGAGTIFDGTNAEPVRVYPWGGAVISDPNVSETQEVQNFVFGPLMRDLTETTNLKLYENFRVEKLSSVSDATSSLHEGFQSSLVGNSISFLH